MAGKISVETEALLILHEVNHPEYESMTDEMKCVKQFEEWSISGMKTSEIRTLCCHIFTYFTYFNNFQFHSDLSLCIYFLPASEIAKRRDLRRECIFTCDPLTARDLDDALSITSLGNGVYIYICLHRTSNSLYFEKNVLKLEQF